MRYIAPETGVVTKEDYDNLYLMVIGMICASPGQQITVPHEGVPVPETPTGLIISKAVIGNATTFRVVTWEQAQEDKASGDDPVTFQ